MPSHTDNFIPLLRTHPRRRRGQTAIIALLVLLLLSFVGGLFVTIVANNLKTQGRSHRTLNADYYAEAGLRYADNQLTNSPDGADWRPPLQYQLSAAMVTQLVGPLGSRAYNRYNALGLPAAPAQDPDLTYLQQGFTAYNTENGRFLLRVTYDPNAAGTRYLKIESVGREGTVTPSDPTTFTNQPPIRLAATLVAYKPIGITDYARFETNKDNRSGVMNIGVPSFYASSATPAGIVTPGVYDFNISSNGASQTVALKQFPVTTTYGDPSSGVGGSFRANGSVRFYGINDFYLNRPATGIGDDVEIAGNLLLDNYNPAVSSLTTGQNAAVIVNPQTSGGVYIAPTNGIDQASGNGVAYTTDGGAVRDGGTGADSNDASGQPRSIARLEPPVIDTVNSATSLTRYQDITENAPERLVPSVNGGVSADGPPATPDPTAGQDGWGQAIYVNNNSDEQRDSSSLVGGHTLVDEWLNRNGGGQSATDTKSGWQGPFYNPPGVDVTFGLQQQAINGSNYSFYGVRLTRSDTDGSGNPMLWKNADGSQGTSPTLTVSYRDLYASNDLTADPGTLSGAALAAYRANPNNDVVIYCEGNVRIKPSLLSAPTNEPAVDTAHNEPRRLYSASSGTDETDDKLPRHITLITNGTAYIEGSILKGNPDSSITILARNYVCLNTTQFYAGAIADQNPQSTQTPSASAADSTLLDFGAQNDVLVQDFIVNPLGTLGSNTALYISGGPSAPGATQTDYDFVNPATGQSLVGGATQQPFDNPLIVSDFDTVNGISFTANGGLETPYPVVAAASSASSLLHMTFNLTGDSNLSNVTAGQPLQLWTRLDPNPIPVAGAVSVTTQDYLQERSAILPMDIQIQAVMYAQDDSFFVIPGPWFNSDSSDNLTSYVANVTSGQLPTRPGVLDTSADQMRFPLYGQPVDLRITINGSVSENRPADITAQASWMAKWGWIPQFHGSLIGQAAGMPTEPSGHSTTGQPSFGLNFVYDPLAGNPYDTGNYLRTDVYGRPLPFTPKLPVSTGLLYAGQSDPQSLLQ